MEGVILKTALVSLNELSPGKVGVVHGLNGGRHFVSRMVSLGFTPGTEVRVVQNYGHGPIIANVRNTRVALGWMEAHKVLVVPEDDEEGNE
jgi:Fe2+ transport system protein FeoA